MTSDTKRKHRCLYLPPSDMAFDEWSLRSKTRDTQNKRHSKRDTLNESLKNFSDNRISPPHLQSPPPTSTNSRIRKNITMKIRRERKISTCFSFFCLSYHKYFTRVLWARITKNPDCSTRLLTYLFALLTSLNRKLVG